MWHTFKRLWIHVYEWKECYCETTTVTWLWNNHILNNTDPHTHSHFTLQPPQLLKTILIMAIVIQTNRPLVSAGHVICCCSCFYLWSISLSGSISPSQSRTGWRAARHGVKWCLTTVSFARWTPALQTWAPSQATWPRLPKAAVVGLWWLFCGTCSRWQTITQLTRCLTASQLDRWIPFRDCFARTIRTVSLERTLHYFK